MTDIIQSIADDREDRTRREFEADDRWLRERGGIDPEERRTSFHRWVKGQLLKTLTWPQDRARREKLLGQCAAEITVMVRQLRGRGWLLDGAVLAEEVKACIEPIAAYQKAGKVGDFLAYFRSSVRRYVGANAENIQAMARRTGSDEAAQSMASVLAGLGLDRLAKPREASIVEIVAGHTPPTKRPGRPRKTPLPDETLPLL